MPILPSTGLDITNRLATWLESLTPQERQSLMDRIGSIGGGTIGAISGGALGAPLGPGGVAAAGAAGAGIGSAAGLGASRMVGPYIGGVPISGKQTTEDLSNEAITGMLAEGVGRLAPATLSAITKLPFRPTPAGQVIQKLAKEYDIPLDLAQATGKPWLESVGLALERAPATTGQVRKFTRLQEARLDPLFAGLRTRRVSPEDLGRELSAIFEKGRSELATDLESALGAVKRTSPLPPGISSADVETTGMELGKGWQANRANISKLAEEKYKPFREAAKTTQIDPEPWYAAGRELQEEFPQGWETVFSSRTKKYLDAMQQQAHTPVAGEFIDTGAGAIQRTVPASMTLHDARLILSELKDAGRRFTYQAKGIDPLVVNKLAKSLESTLDSQLSESPVWKGVKDVNKWYAQKMDALAPPNIHELGAHGNPIAGEIVTHPFPGSRVPTWVGKSAEIGRRLEQAVSPASGELPPGTYDPFNLARRNILQTAEEGAVTPRNRVEFSNPYFKKEYTSPYALAQGLESRMSPESREVFFPPSTPHAQTLEGIGTPEQIRREDLFYKSDLGRAIETGSGNNILSAAFPPRNPSRAATTLTAIREGGGQPELAQNALLTHLEEIGRSTPIRNLQEYGQQAPLNTYAMANEVNRMGETVPSILGTSSPEAPRALFPELERRLQLGNALQYRAKNIGGPGPGAKGYEMEQAGRRMTPTTTQGLLELPVWVGKQAGALGATALGFQRPATVEFLTSPFQFRSGGALAGAAVRTPAQIAMDFAPPPPEPESPFSKYKLAPSQPPKELPTGAESPFSKYQIAK